MKFKPPAKLEHDAVWFRIFMQSVLKINEVNLKIADSRQILSYLNLNSTYIPTHTFLDTCFGLKNEIHILKYRMASFFMYVTKPN